MIRHSATRALTGLLVAATLVAACGGGDDEQVRPFAAVQADEFVFENDPTSTERASFGSRRPNR